MNNNAASFIAVIFLAAINTTSHADNKETTVSAPNGPISVADIQALRDATNKTHTAASRGPVSIAAIQGAAHTSPFADQNVVTTGVVTIPLSIGFYMQDPAGDGDPATSEGIFVFTDSPSPAALGVEVQVTADVLEFFPGGVATGNLSTTLLINPVVQVTNPGPIAIAPVPIGPPPNLDVIDDDGATLFEADMDPLDFYESFEAMIVTIPNGFHVVDGRNIFGEIVGVVDFAGATGTNAQGGITLTETDLNPERVKLQIISEFTPGLDIPVNTGSILSNIVGVVSYSFGFFEVQMTEPPVIELANVPPAENTSLSTLDRDDHLFIASYNVLNLDNHVEPPGSCGGGEDDDLGVGRFFVISSQMRDFMNTPDIIALQEIQDNSGCIDDGNTDASLTYQGLINSLVGVGLPVYEYVDIAPVDGTSGGQPGGNIRNGYLYNSERVTLDPASVELIVDSNPADGDAFENSRNPLSASFTFNGQELTLINVHMRSKGGGTPNFGAVQPPVNGGEAVRVAQAQEINDAVDDILSADPASTVVVLGDFNEFPWNEPVYGSLAGSPAVLTNLTDTLAETDRYSFNFNGNASSLDHVFVTNSGPTWSYDIVNVNTVYLYYAAEPSDHDPILAAAFIPLTDADGDGLDDDQDNCFEVANPSQADSNGDGIGNACDIDIAGPSGAGSDDCFVNFFDLNALRPAFFTNPQSPDWNPDADFTQDGFINFLDLQVMGNDFFRNFTTDNPSGIANDCAE